jgi:hypothetical protein
MKSRLVLGLFAVLAWAASATGQEAVTGGGMENESDWYVYDMGSGTTPSTVEFNYKTDTCAAGRGGCLHMFGTGTYTNTLVWQAVSLACGKTYELNAAFKELTGDATVGTWAQLIVSTEMPVEGTDYKPPAGANTDRLLGFNSWVDQTWGGLDGTFQVDGLTRDDGQKTKTYTAPGDPGQTVEAFLGVKAGVWGTSELSFDVLIDEISLKPVSTAVESKTGGQPADFTLERNYPNPFNPVTRIAYSLPRAETVTFSVYSLSGEEVLRPVDGALHSAGRHELTIDGSRLNSGVYVCKLHTGAGTLTRKIMLVK